ncbi:E3 ubiquitin-protein ligase CIP8-like [Vicia villosa]|uniref:E3 ubiquitin-protein ligase CIP8-like n=1 Tax=Vicia villosa TaxID=3911 RepID=UPI00273C418F|nr:E3 ubiquitin-protein ligase CIP8-like [Vicia villosa]
MDEYYCKAYLDMSSTDVPRDNDPYLHIEFDYTTTRVSSDEINSSLSDTIHYNFSYVSEDRVIRKATIVSWLSEVGVPEDAFALVVEEISQCVSEMGSGMYKNLRDLFIQVDFSVTRNSKECDEDEESNCLDKNEEEMKVEEDEDNHNKDEWSYRWEEEEMEIEVQDNGLTPTVTWTIVDDDHGENEYGDEWDSYWDEEMRIEEDNRSVIEVEVDDDYSFDIEVENDDDYSFDIEVENDDDYSFDIEVENENDEDQWNYGWEEVIGIEEEDIRFVPAAPSCIEGLKMVTIEEAEKCTICHEDFNVGVCMPCSHMFHTNCIKDWLNVGNSCPLCRFQLPTSSTNE